MRTFFIDFGDFQDRRVQPGFFVRGKLEPMKINFRISQVCGQSILAGSFGGEGKCSLQICFSGTDGPGFKAHFGEQDGRGDVVKLKQPLRNIVVVEFPLP